MLLDGKYGREALFRAADHDFWIGRPVEEPGSRPLDFEFGGSLGAKLIEWPVDHTIKCLCFYHPDDPPEMKARQERELLRLYDAARTLGRELLIEIIASKHGPVDDATIAERDRAALCDRRQAGLVEARRPGERARRGTRSSARSTAGDPYAAASCCSASRRRRTILRRPSRRARLRPRQRLRGRPHDLCRAGAGLVRRAHRRREAVERMAGAFARLCDAVAEAGCGAHCDARARFAGESVA